MSRATQNPASALRSPMSKWVKAEKSGCSTGMAALPEEQISLIGRVGPLLTTSGY
jgi:hypothetical protein